jgi:hypothetical protein
MKMLFNFNDEVKEIDADEEIFNRNNVLDNMYFIKKEYQVKDDNKEYKNQFNKNAEILDYLIIEEIQKNYRKVNIENFNYHVYYPRKIDIENGFSLRIRAKDDIEPIRLGFTNDELNTIINFVKKLKDGN